MQPQVSQHFWPPSRSPGLLIHSSSSRRACDSSPLPPSLSSGNMTRWLWQLVPSKVESLRETTTLARSRVNRSVQIREPAGLYEHAPLKGPKDLPAPAHLGQYGCPNATLGARGFSQWYSRI